MLAVSAVGALDLAAGVIVDLSHRLHIAQAIIAAHQQQMQQFNQDTSEALVLRLRSLVVAHLPLYPSKVRAYHSCTVAGVSVAHECLFVNNLSQ